MVNKIKNIELRIISILLLSACLFLLTGCPPADETYSIAEEQYLIGWVLHNVNESTPTVLNYTFGELAVYNYTLNYPAYEPQGYSNILFWVKPIHNYGSAGAAATWNEIDVPLDRVYYLKGDDPGPAYRTNWSLSNYMHINYLISDNRDEQFGLEVAHAEHYESEDVWNAITPIPGDKKHVYFGTAPFTPASVIVEDNYIKLNNRLMRGHNGLSYLKRYTVIGAGESIIYLTPSKYEIYKDGSLISTGNLTYNDVWDYTELYYWLESNGNYTVNISIPSNYPVFNLTLISASFEKPSADISPPELNHIELSPRFEINKTINVSINMTDISGINSFEIFYNTDINESWKSKAVSGSNPYNTSLTVDNNSVQKINLKFKAVDNYNNSALYIIKPVSLRARTIVLNLSSNKTSAIKGETIDINGKCTDNLGLNCSGLIIKYYLNEQYVKADRTEFEDSWQGIKAGEFISNITIPFNFTDSQANISVIFEGTGVYLPKTENLTISLISYDHDLALDNLILSEFEIGSKGTINTTLYNIGLNDEFNVKVNFSINGNVIDNLTISRLNISDSVDISFNWTPAAADIYNVTVDVLPVPGETNLQNNKKSNLIALGPDIDIDLIFSSWRYKVNETITARIDYENIGNEDAVNLTAVLYDMYEYDSFYISYGSTGIEDFDNTTYYITPSKIDENNIRVNITYDNISEEFDLYKNQLVRLQNGIFFDVDWINPTACVIYLSKANTTSKDMPDIVVGDSKTGYLNLTPTILGYHRIKIFVNVSEDVNLTNNYASVEIDIKVDFPDISLGIGIENENQIVNETANITVYLFNEGFIKATNLTLFLYDMHKFQNFYIGYGYPQTISFNNTYYNLTAYKIDSDNVGINISYDNISEEFELHRNQLVRLQNKAYLDVGWIFQSSVRIDLALVANITSIDLPDLPASTSIEEKLALTPKILGQHKLKAFVNASEDSSWINNYGYTYINVKINAADLDTTLSSDMYLPVNISVNATFGIKNAGFKNATNVTAILYDMYEHTGPCLNFNQSSSFEFNNTNYTITGYKIDSETARVNITYNAISEEFTLFLNQFVKLQNGIFFELEWIYEGGYADGFCFYLEKGIKYEKFLGNITVNECSEGKINWTPTIVGNHILKLFVNTTEDGDWTNNYDVDWVNVMADAPDVTGWIYPIGALIVNEQNTIDYVIENIGFYNATNVTAEFYYACDKYGNYTFINSTFIGDIELQDYIANEFNWTPAEEGYCALKLVINASEDGDWDNNIYYRSVVISTDIDNDGIPDIEDMLIGHSNDVNSTLNITVYLDNSTSLGGYMSGVKNLDFRIDNESIIGFDFEFYPHQLILPNIFVESEPISSACGYLIIYGIDLAEQNKTKTVYVNRIAESDILCIKDAEIAFISEISDNCNGDNETTINCPGTANDYNCSIIGSQYRIDGLSYSGIREEEEAAPPPRRGGGGTVCTPYWSCGEWSECSVLGIQTKVCIDTKCNTGNTTETRSCMPFIEEAMPEIIPEKKIEPKQIFIEKVIEIKEFIEEKELKEWFANFFSAFFITLVTILILLTTGYYIKKGVIIRRVKLKHEFDFELEEMHDLILKGNIKDLKEKYNVLKKLYNQLSDKYKPEARKKIINVYKAIKNHRKVNTKK